MNSSDVTRAGLGSSLASDNPTEMQSSLQADRPASAQAMQRMLHVALRRRGWIIAAILICEALAIASNVTSKPVFESTSTIELNKSGSGSLSLGVDDAMGGAIASGGGNLDVDLQTETAILQGKSLALAVITRLGLASQPPFAPSLKQEKAQGNASETTADASEATFDPATRTRLLGIFAGHLKVKPTRGTRLIEISFDSENPKQAADVANAIVESYKDQYLQSHYTATAEASQWLTRQLSDLKGNVEESEKKLTDFEKQSGILSVGGGDGGSAGGDAGIHSVVIQKLDALNSELTAAEANRIQKEAIYRLANSGNADVVSSLNNDPMALSTGSSVLGQAGGLSALDALRQQRHQLNIAIADGQQIYGPNNRHMKDLQTQMQALDAQIQQELHEISSRAKGDYELAQQTEAAIRKQFDAQKADAAQVNEKMVQFAVLNQEARSRKQLYEDLYTKLQEANVSAGIKATNITVVDPARTESNPISPRKTVNLALGLMIGLCFGLATAFTVDNLDRTIVSPAEIENMSGIPQIGVIPRTVPKGVATTGFRPGKHSKPELNTTSPVWMIDAPQSAAAEAVRALRTSIMLSRAGGGPKVILLTSCVPGEGKTTLTTNLAISYAQHNMRVIIVEADMRRPRMKWAIEAQNEIGLSNVLTGSARFEDAVQHGLHVSSLDLLSAGPRPPMPSEILGSNVFDQLIQKLRAEYDIVLIDSPPSLLVTDAVAISTKADAVVWVARLGVVTRPQIARATDLMARNRMPIIGFVANQMTREMANYGYDYSYGLYETYYGDKESDDA